ncbi:hypothetical protein FOCC_FOCC005346 [Frankliniella occidentalis]|uniref:Uncharacterized protein LOC113215161 n=1 Tax=Frankliniella occidentalis TaxID=133901 RepID=A0A6J1TCP3_FRAOC|nr:uncharacterized protein LOC113215161 [Frankliniella occidentalis]KAE8747956.1 hypothetical protein FOCC_FOCC005346 [Frankliniella occidentalis]
MTNFKAALSLAVVLVLCALAGQLAAADADVCGGRVGQVCTGCDRLAVCARIDGTHAIPLFNMQCPPYAPFCRQGRCVRFMDSNNPCDIGPSVSTSFQCPGQDYTGYLPDPVSCSRYHYCVNGTAWDYECRVGLNTVYDHASAACVPNNKAACQTCAGAGYAVYAQDNTIAFNCNDPFGPSVVLCPPNHRLDTESTACVRYCSRDGRQAASNDPTSRLYYECVLDVRGVVGEPVLKTCPEGTVFDSRRERCTGDESNNEASTPYDNLV